MRHERISIPATLFVLGAKRAFFVRGSRNDGLSAAEKGRERRFARRFFASLFDKMDKMARKTALFPPIWRIVVQDETILDDFIVIFHE